MLRGSDLHPIACRACAEVCERCAVACERTAGGDELVRACAQLCRRCAASCAAMASAAAADRVGKGRQQAGTAAS